MKRPTSLVIVAVLFILGGLGAVWDVVSGLLNSRVSINFGVLALFAGIGLLRLSRGWRVCALVLVWLMFGLVAFVMGTLIFAPDSVWVRFGSGDMAAHPLPIAWAFAAIFCSFLIWIYRVLTRHDIRLLFGLEDAQQITGANAG